MDLKPIAHIENDFLTKFGLPRQSGMSEHLISRIVMEGEYRNPDAFRGIESFDYLWLIWLFEPMGKREWSPTVRPPKLGGNKRMGVFATRSPNRPNPIGLTRVKLLAVEHGENLGTVLKVSGADMMNGTRILDIKPYLSFADSVPDASFGEYGGSAAQELLTVEIPQHIAELYSDEQLKALHEALMYDPRPGYQNDDHRIYGFTYGGYDIQFQVHDHIVVVTGAVKL